MSKFINDIYEHLAILLSNKISFGFFHQRYFIGYLYNHSKVMSLHIMLTTVLKTTTFNCIKKKLLQLLLHWGNQTPFTDKDQGTSSN